MSAGIQILPRIKHGTTYVPTVGAISSPLVNDTQDGEPHATSSTQSDQPSEPVNTPKAQDNTLLIVVFAIIIVSLIILILWLVSRSDTGKRWLNNTPEDKRARLRELTRGPGMQLDVPKPEGVNHKSVLGNASEDELRKYASMPIHDIAVPVIKTAVFTADIPVDKPKVARVEVVEDNDSDSDSSSESDSTSESDSEDESNQDDTKRIAEQRDRENDDIVDQEFNRKLQQFSQEPTDNDITDIKKEMDRAIDNMSDQVVQDNPFPIQQMNNKGEPTKVYDDRDSLTEDGYDYTAVIKCCNGNQKMHKSHKWKFIS